MRQLLLAAVLGLALLSGCIGSEDGPETLGTEAVSEDFTAEQFQGPADAGTPAGTPQAHGEPQREESAVETGGNPLQFPGSYARKTVTITNDFGGASLGILSIGVAAGSIQVHPGSGPGYELVAVLEAHASTEQEARDALDRMTLSHEDDLQEDGLHLTTGVRYEPATAPVPFLTLGSGTWTQADLALTVPAGPAYDLWAYASSGDVTIEDLRGPRMRLDTSSGDIEARSLNLGALEVDVSSGNIVLETLQADRLLLSVSSGDVDGSKLSIGKLEADSSSGSLGLQGRFGDIVASASSGDIDLSARPLRSGHYQLDASSGSITLELGVGAAFGYDVTADTSSGDIDVDLPDTEVIEDDEDGEHLRVLSLGFDEAATQVVVEADTSSGDITVTALGSIL